MGPRNPTPRATAPVGAWGHQPRPTVPGKRRGPRTSPRTSRTAEARSALQEREELAGGPPGVGPGGENAPRGGCVGAPDVEDGEAAGEAGVAPEGEEGHLEALAGGGAGLVGVHVVGE